MAKRILLTGGCGYIGSHICLELIEQGYQPVVLDNLSNSSTTPLQRIEQLTGQHIPFIEGDVRDEAILDHIFSTYELSATIHLAGLKSVAESVAAPIAYYQTNFGGTVALCQAMQRHRVKHFIYSSSATVYGLTAQSPIREDAPTAPASPYGQSKLMAEIALRDIAHADPQWKIAILRYFNPVGAHACGQIGEDPCGVPNNLMPYVSQVAAGKQPKIRIFGNDYPTPDGTGMRDYLHVCDLAHAHLCALRWLDGASGAKVFNLGTGRGYSVLEIIRAYEKACGHALPFQFLPRRDGDIASYHAEPALATRELRWSATRTIEDMCRDAWNWQSRNPNGYT
ncbi:UDP-glucose 4-epimerase [Pseudomonas sp. ATCC 13867]|uniref:UDP-glucose 4-epimerase GalE n=1 Tax=Pseudomonas sp. ATCC 13867 TaxID=1294143 RepID=UPI0002C4E96C|nr:UDP-glucose 4-epimerase GalE [Pseudomonas sp. ATCC 13867]AGI22872.1 UDP-glucose 4-epimerase [Pseudomonas sp. ATCC 13867]RFQ31336.1 UDP-glucose 4-epimerase GalE [Pseudomonas sp. ATCC 13867]